MSGQVYKIFEEVEFKAKLLAKYWNNFSTEISQHLPDTYHPEMQDLSTKLEEALSKLVDELNHPTLILATTGTTSSGKSTLVNLLCGAEIVPVAVSEMSAGAVTIKYSQEKSLKIDETAGAKGLWECREWKNISEEEIYQRLYQTMTTYIDNREKLPSLACPQSTIYYPFRLVKESQLPLPPGTTVRLLDLPGFAHVGDTGNANVIKQCREALCIVTYNSAETDSQKVKSLLLEVVQQVKELGGSPARMLFVLNRIDIFRADKNWPETENRFVEKTICDIKNELTEQLKEYTEDIENLKVVKLSTWPALLSIQIENLNNDHSADACKKADNYFNLIIEEILADLSRNAKNWSRHDRSRVAQALWQKSYAEEFQKHLREHIAQHFPQLVIPQLIERFNTTAGNAIKEWATHTTTAIINSSEEKYKQECEKILQIRLELKQFLEISAANLRQPFGKIDQKVKQYLEGQTEEDLVLYLESTIAELKNITPYSALGEKLYPLYGWRREIGQGINQVLETIAKSLESGKVDLDSPNLKKANRLHVNLLVKNLSRLLDSGYTGSVAKNGQIREAKTDQEKNNLKRLNEELNELAIHLTIVMADVVNQISNQAVNRMYEAVAELFNCHLDFLGKGANKLAPNLAIKFPESQLGKTDSHLTFNFNFQAGFPITKGEWEEEIKENIRKRVWWKLWLGKATITETKYEKRPSDNAKIPSVEDLLSGWIIQAKNAEPEIINQIILWLLEQIDCLKKNVEKTQNDIIDRYQIRLDQAYQEISLDYEKERNVWQPIHEKAQNLAEEFDNLAKFLK